MTYLPVKDLKKTRELWLLLAREKEVVITRDGIPCAVLIGVSPETVDESIREIRRSLFSLAVGRARAVAKEAPISPRQIEAEISASRAGRSAG